MTVENSNAEGDKTTSHSDPAHESRILIRKALKAALATSDIGTGFPYASLVTTATTFDGAPVILISTLARHTQNILQDCRASLLFDGTDGFGDPLQGGRVSVYGRANKIEDSSTRKRFLSRHPESALYADFKDFSFYQIQVEGAHYVGGFGAIHDIAPSGLLTDLSDAEDLRMAEPEIVAHMNDDHADAVELYATGLLGRPPGPWRFTGCDPEGCDLVLGAEAARITFPTRVTTPQAIRQVLVALAGQARAV